MKGFLRKVLLIASFGAALTFYGCNKDYGQDIEDVRKDLTAALEEQKSTLTAAINAALEDAKKYAAEADQAIKESAEAYADAAAKQAASEVKAELLTEIQNQVADALADAKKYTDDEISKLKTEISGRIDAIDSDINTIKSTLTEYETRIAALETFKAQAENRIAILEDFMSKIEGLNLEDEIAKLNQVIADLQTLRNDFEAAIDGIEDDIDAINTTLADYETRLDDIDAAIEDINANLLAIEDMIANRLTSISLIPEAYYEGIPAIKLNYIAYSPITVAPTEGTVISNSTMMLPAVSANQFRYNVSPSTWSIASISNSAYVLEDAEILTKAYNENTVFDVVSVEKNDRGELVANVRVRNTGAFASLTEQSETNVLNTAALQLTIADKYLTDAEKEAGAPVKVTSEYSVVGNVAGSIHIAPNEEACVLDHAYYYRSYKNSDEILGAAESANPSDVQEVYNATLDLSKLVRVCITENGKLISLDSEALAGDYSYLGLSFKFAIPTEKFVIGDNNTDQQEFIKFVEGSTSEVQSVIPGGATNNEAAIGKTPVVRVELLASNGDIVDVQWIKIEWVREKVQDYDLGEIFTSEYTLSCNGHEDIITWSDFVEKILGKIGENGMSYSDFYEYYSGGSALIDDYNFAQAFETKINFDRLPVDPGSSVITFTVEPEGFAGVIDDILASEDGVASYRIKYILDPKDSTRHGKIIFIVTVNVVLPNDMPTFHGKNLTMNWTAEDLAAIHPVGYAKGTAAGATKVYYNFPMNDLFTVNSDGLFVDNIYDCRAWDMQMSSDINIPGFGVGFASPALFAGDNSQAGYYISKGANSFAARFAYNNLAVDAASANWYTSESEPQQISFVLADEIKYTKGNAEDAKELLNDVNVSDDARKVIPVNIWSRISTDNEYLVKAFNIWVVSPVSVPAPVVSDAIQDVNKNTITVKLPIDYANVTIKDFQNQPIKAGDEYNYYGIYGPNWDLEGDVASKILTNVVDVENDWDVDENVDPTVDFARMKTAKDLGLEVSFDSKSGSLVFTNISTHLVKDIKLFIRAEYGHQFGDYETFVTIPFSANSTK